METQRRTFLSYSRANKDFAVKLAKELKAEGFQVWLDQLDIPPGSRWDVEVEKALVECDIFMVIITQASSTSENVLDEIGYAIDTGKRMLPVLLEKTNVPLRLRRFQYVDFTDKGFEEGVRSAKNLLRSLIAQPTVPREKTDEVSEDVPARAQAAQARAEEARRREQEAALERGLPETPSTAVVGTAPQPVPTKSRSRLIGVLGLGALVLIVAVYGTIRVFSGLTSAREIDESPVEGAVLPTDALPVIPNTEEPTLTPMPADTLTPAATPTAASTISDSRGVQMVLVPEGEFTMGSDRGEPDEQPVHVVHLDAFYIDKYEVTNKMYKECVDGGECDPPRQIYFFAENPSRIYFGNSQFDDFPVVYVDWNMARAYCQWRDARLPTEAEWEKAARGTEGDTYPWGRDLDCQRANHERCVNRTDRAGSYEAGKSPYGAYDMAGNVAEWVGDWYSGNYYTNSPRSNPRGPVSGQSRVLRGGSWPRYDVTTFHRSSFAPTYNTFDIGFRCARDAAP